LVKVLSEIGCLPLARQFAGEISVNYMYDKIQAFIWISRYSGVPEDLNVVDVLLSKMARFDALLYQQCQLDAKLSSKKYHITVALDAFSACLALKGAMQQLCTQHRSVNSLAAKKEIERCLSSISSKILEM